MGVRRKLPTIVLLYVIEGFPMGVFMHVWPVFLLRQGASKVEIGLLAGLKLAWSAKVLWSPLIDRYGERRQWIAGAMLVMAVCLATIATADVGPIATALWIAFGVYCLASATQDVAIDAYSIGFTDPGEEGPVNSAKVAAYRGGLLLATGLLFLPAVIGWLATIALAAALSAAMAFSAFHAPRIDVSPAARGDTLTALRAWLGGGQGFSVIAFAMLYRLGDQAMGPMLTPFWTDRGFSNEEIATVSSALGIGAYVAGAAVGGVVVARIGIRRGLWLFGALALLSNLGYAAAAALPETGKAGVYAASLTESLCGGLVTAAFLSYLMRIAERDHAAVQYALLTAAYALPGALAASQSGYLAEWLGYAEYFALTAALALPAFFFLPRAALRISPDAPNQTIE